MTDAIKLYVLILVWVTVALIQGNRDARKQKICLPVILQSYQSVWTEFSIVFRLIDLMNLEIILVRMISVQARELYIGGFVN